MANKTQQIRIESILGGHSKLEWFSNPDQFRTGIGIDPSLAMPTISSSARPGLGLLQPVCGYWLGTTASRPLWIVPNPKNSNVYVYDSGGSVYTEWGVGVGDLNDGCSSSGNGASYYDNYLYCARDTTVARYGPLNGTPAWTDDYWVTTLSKTALSNTTTYPEDSFVGAKYPNHFLLRHSDGRLYIADVVDNQCTIHYIQTKKTTVEGDTDDGSRYDALRLGRGVYPTALASWNDFIVIAGYENEGNSYYRTTTAKLYLWDGVSEKPSQQLFSEFPDQMITAMKNINGVLYLTSGNNRVGGFRLSRYIGGSSIEEVAYIEQGQAPMPGAIDGTANRVLVGSFTAFPYLASCIYSYGLQNSSIGQGLFIPVRGNEPVADSFSVTSLAITNGLISKSTPMFGLACSNPLNNSYIQNSDGSDFSTSNAYWQSQIYKIGGKFKITKVAIPIADYEGSGGSIVVTIYCDQKANSAGATHALGTINETTYPGTKKERVVFRPTNAVGSHSFYLELKWDGTEGWIVGLPIEIEYEIIDD